MNVLGSQYEKYAGWMSSFEGVYCVVEKTEYVWEIVPCDMG